MTTTNPTNTITLEFYPTPYGHEDIGVHAMTWENHRTIIDTLIKQGYQVKPMYTAMKGPDCFYQVEQVEDLQFLKMELERLQLVESVQISPITIKTLDNKTFEPGLRIHVPLPEVRRRRRW